MWDDKLWRIRVISSSAYSNDLRRLSTSSTVRANELGNREPAITAGSVCPGKDDGATAANPIDDPAIDDAGAMPEIRWMLLVLSRLALRLRRAPLVNFSCH